MTFNWTFVVYLQITKATQIRHKAKLEMEQGPLVAALDSTLQEFRVHRQAYYGKSFVGNHIHKCCKVSAFFMCIHEHIFSFDMNMFTLICFIIYYLLQPENIQKLTDAIVNTTTAVCPMSPSRHRDAQLIATKYKKLLSLFASCHHIYSVSKQLDGETTDQLGRLIFTGLPPHFIL